jgi:hypothetical protein
MRDGPSLQDYIETRFNLLADAVRDAERSHREELLRFAQEAKDAASALRHFVELGREETDLRYQQRFEAQSAALAAAFLSQQTAMQTAFQVAEKAVQAALAAADRAVSKAELAGDKRFEALNELRQMLNDMVATLITRQEAIQRFDAVAEKVEKADHRVEAIEARLNRMTGGQEGGQERRQNLRASTGVAVSIGSGILGLIGLLIVLWKLSVGR